MKSISTKTGNRKKVHVLMSIDMSKTEVKRPYHVPVAWIKRVRRRSFTSTTSVTGKKPGQTPIF
ncbi:MAG: hypothetical protein R3C11_25655 [Planctomycetaceae bacterium]